ncbi:hypothetical protein [Comamonas resistens]|uniref:hypothetical protein n=1 Tax=Comamonas resistens TaxID=3046670 RepID=UPI0039BD8AF0
MQYFQISEDDCLVIQNVAEKLGTLVGLLELIGDKYLVSVTADQMHSALCDNFEALRDIVPALFERGPVEHLLATPQPSTKGSRRSREHLAQGAVA